MVAVAALAILATGAIVAAWRVRTEAAHLGDSLQAEAAGLASSVDPDLLGQLSLTSSDAGLAAWRRLGDLLTAYAELNPAHAVFLAALRDGELRLSTAEGAADASSIALELSTYRSMERAGRATIALDREAGVAIALAPIVSSASGVTVGAAGMQVDLRQWQAPAWRQFWPPVASALLAVALLLGAFGMFEWRGRQTPARQQHWRHLETMVAGATCILITGVAVGIAARTDSNQQEDMFQALASTQLAGVRSEMSEIQAQLGSLGRFFSSSSYVSRQEFASFVDQTLNPGVLAYEWAPAVEPSALRVYQSLAQQEGMSGLTVWDLDAAGRAQPVDAARVSYPVFYIEPYVGNESLIGYDQGSDPFRADALVRAASEGLCTASEPVSLLESGASAWGALLAQPVMAGDGGGLQGYVIAALDWQALLQAALDMDDGEAPLVAIDIVDLAPGDGGPLLLASSNQGASDWPAGAGYVLPEGLDRAEPLLAYGRTVALVYRPTEAYSGLQGGRTWPAVAVAGLSLGAIVTLVVGLLRQRETTLRRLIEERTAALADSEAHYRALYEEALNPILVADSEGRFVDANDAAVDYLCRSREELLGKRLWDLAPRSSATRAPRTQTPFGLRRTLEADLQVGEQIKTLLMNIIPVRKGERMTLFAIGQDITERKAAGRQLERRYAFERTLAAASARFVGEVSYDAAVGDTLTDIGALTGAARVYLYGLEDGGRCLGSTNEWCAPGVEPQGDALRRLSGDYLARWLAKLSSGEIIVIADVAAMDQEAGGSSDSTARAAQEALLEHSIHSVVALPVFVQGTLCGVVGLDNLSVPEGCSEDDIALLGTFAGIISNYLERVQAQDARLNLERQLLESQKLESLGVLAGGIAHEFNNLLATILGNLDLASVDLAEGTGTRHSVDESAAAARRAADLTRQMLNYSGKGHFQVTELDLSALVDAHSQMFRAAIPRTATLEYNLGRDLPNMRGDAGQLQQVIMNLLGNAADALQGGPGQVTLATGVNRLTARALAGNRTGQELQPGEYVWLEIRDTGQGMDADTVKRMFEPFYTTKGPGRGLGLGAVLGIVRGHGGGVWVQSQPGRGTLVRVVFPALAREVPPQKPAAAEAGGDARLTGGALIVDDEDPVRRLNQHVLARMGLQTFVASGGEQAVALYREHQDEINVVLLDLTMPGMDGVATLEALRRINPHVRAVLCSGYGEQVASERFHNLDLAGFVQKPFQIAELRAAVEKALKAS